jgi:hypothetical protein
MPIGLAFGPFIISMAFSSVIMLLDFTVPFELKKPVFTLLLLTPIMAFLPIIHSDQNGRGIERTIGGIIGLHLGYWPIAIFALLWPTIVGFLWIIQCISIWRSSYPPFRIGIWAGMGACTGLVVGKIGVEVLGASFLITISLFALLFPLFHWMIGQLPPDEEE